MSAGRSNSLPYLPYAPYHPEAVKVSSVRLQPVVEEQELQVVEDAGQEEGQQGDDEFVSRRLLSLRLPGRP